MRKLSSRAWLALVLVAGVAVAAENESVTEWKTIETEPITIKVRPRPDGDGKEVWAEGAMNADARDIQAALYDVESYRLFLPYVKESREVTTEPDGTRVTYTRLDLPVVSSRDYVCRVVNDSKLNADGTGAFKQRWWAVPDLLPKRHSVVRLPRNEGSWEVTSRGEGQAYAVYKFSVDPGGSIPGFLANMGQKGGVLDTWKAVEKRAHLLAGERKKAVEKVPEAPSEAKAPAAE